MIVKKCLDDNFKLKKSIFAKNPGALFAFKKISTNQNLEPTLTLPFDMEVFL